MSYDVRSFRRIEGRRGRGLGGGDLEHAGSKGRVKGL